MLILFIYLSPFEQSSVKFLYIKTVIKKILILIEKFFEMHFVIDKNIKIIYFTIFITYETNLF